MEKIKLRYATKSTFKQAEVRQIIETVTLKNQYDADIIAADHFGVDFPSIATNEPLERDLVAMVRHKAVSAYKYILEPCIVEHAGLILEDYADKNYPGGLTQPMWDALDAEGFLKSVSWAARNVIARAVVGYCDGLTVHVFSGETRGTLAELPIGEREFYWDTIFLPESGDGLTYAQIASGTDGLRKKVELSQSKKAMVKCMEFMLLQDPAMFPRI
jgi:XTP/dITP diphosphohydrolase